MLLEGPWLDPNASLPLRCADRIALQGEGFAHLGRMDSVVKVGGRRVDLSEIESRLRRVPGVTDARVLAQPTPTIRGLDLWAAVEAEGVTAAQLKQALAPHLDPVTRPRRFRIVPRFPRTAAGKLTQRNLMTLFDRPADSPDAAHAETGSCSPSDAAATQAGRRPQHGL